MPDEPVNQWLDAKRVRALAESLLVPGPQMETGSGESIFGNQFEGFAGPSTGSVSEPEQSAGQPAEPSKTPEAGPTVVSEKPEATPAAQPPKVSKPETESPVAETPPRGPVTEKTPAPATTPPQTETAPRYLNPHTAGKSQTETPQAAPVSRPQPEKEYPPIVPKLVQQRRTDPRQSTRPRSDSSAVPSGAPIQSPFKIAQDQPARQTPPAQESRENEGPRSLPLSKRLQAFGGWLKQQIPTQAYFICDRNGEIVVDEVGSEKLIKVARNLAQASISAGRQVGEDGSLASLHVKIGPERVMEVFPKQSHFGLVVLGLIVERPLSREAAGSVSRALNTALGEGSSTGQ